MVKLTKEQKAELEALDKLSDDEIDLSDIPEQPIDWSKAKVGMFYQPDWQDVTLRLDQNVVDWFEENAENPMAGHRDINRVLMDDIWRVRFSGKTNVTTVREAIEGVIATIEEWDAAGVQKWLEAQTRYAIIDPILRALGWDTADLKACHPEWQHEGSRQRVDYALFPRSTTHDFVRREAIPAIIIECKAFRKEPWEEHLNQLQAYVEAEANMTEGLAVLTNGNKWFLYLFGDGHRLEDIVPHVVDLTNDAPDFIAEKLNELMGRQNW